MRFWLWDIFHIELKAPTSHLLFHINFFGGDSDRDLSLTIGTRLFFFHIALQGILPRSWQPRTDYKSSFGKERCFGVSYHSSALWLSLWQDEMGSSRNQPWYMKQLVIEMPWRREWVRTSILLEDGTWEHETPRTRREQRKFKAMPKKDAQTLALTKDRERREYLKKNKYRRTYGYTYTLQSGKVQLVNAEIGVEEREWRPKWFKWVNWFSQIRRTIAVEFSEEIGEQTGTWKGGVLGCGYDLRQNETPLECLRRMERERRFR